MPSSNPRVNLTLKPEQYALLKRMSALQGRPMAAIFVELFDTVAPVLERMCLAMEAVKAAPDNMKAGMLKAFEEAEQAALPFLMSAAEVVDKGLSVGKAGAKAGTPGRRQATTDAPEARGRRVAATKRTNPGNRNDPGQVSTGSGRKTAPSSRKSATSKGKR